MLWRYFRCSSAHICTRLIVSLRYFGRRGGRGGKSFRSKALKFALARRLSNASFSCPRNETIS